ncbi:MAG: rhodanese-like domain-containing protein [Saprospiraceae bacterium]|nr:rhodanese-like domain-containing protein [Saprospiraceae bacterium]MCB9324900.1 rhodanese-like domain-containing protein [Lewinellaceae bacterium]
MKLTFISLFLLIFTFPFSGCAQKDPQLNAGCMDEKFDQKVNQLLSYSVPVMDVDQLKNEKEKVVILDAREKVEYDVSHIEGAQWIGFDHFDSTALQQIPKDSKIVVYCSVGYRSEKIGERLQKMGYTDVNNLYGSIFEWVNRGNNVVDKNGLITRKVHTYNKNWSQWVDETKAEKTW